MSKVLISVKCKGTQSEINAIEDGILEFLCTMFCDAYHLTVEDLETDDRHLMQAIVSESGVQKEVSIEKPLTYKKKDKGSYTLLKYELLVDCLPYETCNTLFEYISQKAPQVELSGHIISNTKPSPSVSVTTKDSMLHFEIYEEHDGKMREARFAFDPSAGQYMK